MDRRTFLKRAASVGGAALASSFLPSRLLGEQTPATVPVIFIKTTDRASGVAHAIDMLGPGGFKGKEILVKANYNSSDPPPGSTHTDTLAALLNKLKALGGGQITIGERSGMGETRKVLETRGVTRLASETGAKLVVYDEMPESEWEPVRSDAAHWKNGFFVPSILLKSPAVVQTCCLKTHRFGGHFTLSLKNSVGLAAKFVPGNPYNFMHELHGSPDQRRMIAEINAAYKPDLVVLDGVEAFATGGPESGKKIQPGVILAGADRVAIDAVGVAILRHFGTTAEVSTGPIFGLDQIARAVELKLGVGGPKQIRLVTDDPASAEYAGKIQAVLDQG